MALETTMAAIWLHLLHRSYRDFLHVAEESATFLPRNWQLQYATIMKVEHAATWELFH